MLLANILKIKVCILTYTASLFKQTIMHNVLIFKTKHYLNISLFSLSLSLSLKLKFLLNVNISNI